MNQYQIESMYGGNQASKDPVQGLLGNQNGSQQNSQYRQQMRY